MENTADIMKSVKNKANNAAMSWFFSFQHNQTSASNNHAGVLKIRPSHWEDGACV